MTTDARITALERQVKAQDDDLIRLMEMLQDVMAMAREQNTVARDLATTVEMIVRQVGSLSDRLEGDEL